MPAHVRMCIHVYNYAYIYVKVFQPTPMSLICLQYAWHINKRLWN